MIEPNYRQGGWLGIITAGALWIELHDAAEYEKNVHKLALAIYNSAQEYAAAGLMDLNSSSSSGGGGVGSGGGSSGGGGAQEDGESEFSVAEMRGQCRCYSGKTF